MSSDQTLPDKQKKRKGPKHWAMFVLRWGIAVAGVWYVLAHMTLRDQAWVILDKTTNRPQQVLLAHRVPEDAATFPIIDPKTHHVVDLPRADVVNEPDQKSVQLRDGTFRKLLALDLIGDLNHNARVDQFLVEDPHTLNGVWIPPSEVQNYEVKVPHPRDQVGLMSMIVDARPALLWASVCVFVLTFIITSYRWHELLKALDIHLTLGRTFAINMVACFYNTFMPGSTGGDLVKAYYASKQTPHRMRAVMSVLVDRAIGLLALIFVGGVAAGRQWDIPACRKVAIAAIAICGCVLVGLLIFYDPRLHRLSGLDFILRKLPKQHHVRAAIEAMHMYGRRPLLVLWSLIISMPVHGTVILSAMFAGMAFGLPLHWSYYWVCVPVIVLAGAIPISPQGAGVMEAFAVLLTRNQGVSVSQAFALAMSIRLVQILWNLTGVIFVIRGGYHAPSEKEAAELEEDGDDDNAPTDSSPASGLGAPAVIT
ncbi:MAG TPA: lysylphosphatidylglycerol synthase transmembrane domain-containing protein [Tepidisphaeraceae bacterium]|nr:lysylphosphatidylglycerol synthase transmembrane domain-containing protein [Tepidisphaeraceae bacterium]